MENSPLQTINNDKTITEEEMCYFVVDNQDYYMRKWRSSKRPGIYSGWNWPAFLAGIYWFGYRKLYKVIPFILGLNLLINIIQIYVKFNITICGQIAIWIIFGFKANALYYRHMVKKIDTIKSDMPNMISYNNKITAAGGTSWGGVGIAFLMSLAYAVILILL